MRCLFDFSSYYSICLVHIDRSTIFQLITKFINNVDCDFNFIILFIDVIMSLYTVNLDDISLFTNLSFLFLAILNLYMIYSINLNEYFLIFSK
jgi:hypothetical protein